MFEKKLLMYRIWDSMRNEYNSGHFTIKSQFLGVKLWRFAMWVTAYGLCGCSWPIKIQFWNQRFDPRIWRSLSFSCRFVTNPGIQHNTDYSVSHVIDDIWHIYYFLILSLMPSRCSIDALHRISLSQTGWCVRCSDVEILAIVSPIKFDSSLMQVNMQVNNPSNLFFV